MRTILIFPLLSAAAVFLGIATYADESPRKIGLQKRVAWTTSRLTGSLETPPPYRTERIFDALKFAEPVTIARMPGADRQFVLELRGKLYSFPDDPTTKQLDLVADFAKIPGHYRSYGLAFHPRFQENRFVYVCYVLKANNPKGSRVSRFKLTNTDRPRLDLQSETLIVDWPSGGHNGGCLQFGKDGCLYISTGDGSSPHPPDGLNTGQDISDLLSSILRIDVDRADPGKQYAIPKDNPFVAMSGARGEVWAYGLRNPWKMSFDRKTGDLWVGDVGWEMWEYVFRVERGGNYGWSIVEGRQPVRPDTKRGPTPISPPIVDHPHTESRSLTGGLFYYGKSLKDLHGAYIYGDYVTGKLWGLRYDGKKVTWQKHLADSPLQVIDFGEGHDGELYILEHGGTINRLVVNASAKVNLNFPRKLSETGLYVSVKGHTPAAGVLTYSINAEPWADHATMERLFASPGTPKLATYTTANLQAGIVKGAWIYPTDTVLAKTLSLEMERGNPASLRRLETQVLHRDGPDWRAYTYMWNDEQTDAVLVGPDGFDRTYVIKDASAPNGTRQQTWRFASRTECLVCHTTRAGSILGFNIPQLNRPHTYGKLDGDQLATLAHLDLFEQKPIEPVPRIANPFDRKASIDDRARAYLHTNCAHCHRRGGGGTAVFELQYDLPLPKTLMVGTPPAQGTFGIHSAMNVAAGDPFRSVIYYRMAKLGRGRMPYFGSNVIDEAGLTLIHDWIKSLDPQAKLTSLSEAQRSALTEIKTPARSKAAATRLLSSPSGALALLHAFDTRRMPDATRKAILAEATMHSDADVRDLFERFVPEEQRAKRLGSVVKPAELLALKGDINRGRKVFLETGRCVNCHRTDGIGNDIGPDLRQIGKKLDRAKILDSILNPSKNIEPEYVTYLFEMKSGMVYSGLIVSKNKTEIVMKDVQGKIAALAVDDIETLSPQRNSLMPELLFRDMTAQELADLVEYLASRR